MDILIIIVLIVAAVILFLVELFVIPGISIAGILAGACMIYANYYAFAYLGTTAGFITLGVSAIACIGSLILFMRSKTLDKVALKKNITSKVDHMPAAREITIRMWPLHRLALGSVRSVVEQKSSRRLI